MPEPQGMLVVPPELEVGDREVEARISWLGMTAVAGEVEVGGGHRWKP